MNNLKQTIDLVISIEEFFNEYIMKLPSVSGIVGDCKPTTRTAKISGENIEVKIINNIHVAKSESKPKNLSSKKVATAEDLKFITKEMIGKFSKPIWDLDFKERTHNALLNRRFMSLNPQQEILLGKLTQNSTLAEYLLLFKRMSSRTCNLSLFGEISITEMLIKLGIYDENQDPSFDKFFLLCNFIQRGNSQSGEDVVAELSKLIN